MNWSKLIKDLMDSGFSQARIAKLCDTGQSYISGLYNGSKKSPSWILGNRIIKLHAKRCGSKKAA